MSSKFGVSISPFAERHYIKKFQKKYKRAWDVTKDALIRELQSIEVLFQKSIAEIIVGGGDVKICKVEFTVAGTKQSRHGSGNRCIVALHTNEHRISVLLVYHKNDMGEGNETACWKNMIKENYHEYRGLL